MNSTKDVEVSRLTQLTEWSVWVECKQWTTAVVAVAHQLPSEEYSSLGTILTQSALDALNFLGLGYTRFGFDSKIAEYDKAQDCVMQAISTLLVCEQLSLLSDTEVQQLKAQAESLLQKIGRSIGALHKKQKERQQ